MTPDNPVLGRSPHPLHDPEAYLSLRKFSSRIKCSRTGLPVSFADMGDEQGTPVLWVLPSGCSRWVAAAQDPLARMYGIRLIVIDRPGCGATPVVPLGDRIRISGEHLNIKPAHLTVNSAGIYYALDLLLNHFHIFATSLSPPPSVYMVSPWSPLLPSNHPDYYPSYFTWIPTPLIATQHITLPQLAKLAETSSSLWNTGSKAFWSGISAAKGFFDPPSSSAPSVDGNGSTSGFFNRPHGDKSIERGQGHDHDHDHDHDHQVLPSTTEIATVPPKAAPMTVDGVAYKDEEYAPTLMTESHKQGDEVIDAGEMEVELGSHGDGLWGRFPCCVGCTTTEYMQAENFSGIGQEHLICLNRGPMDTGHTYLERTIDALAEKLGGKGGHAGGGDGDGVGKGEAPGELDVRIWWGWLDTMVPRKGQIWFNRNIERYPERIKVQIRDVADGDHTDLLARAEGIYEVYALIRSREREKHGLVDEDTEEGDAL